MKSIKFFGFAVTLVSFFLTTLPLYPLFLFFPVFLRRFLIRIVSFYSRILLAILNIKVVFKGFENYQLNRNQLIVSNHLSYIDVLMMCSRMPSAFVTSKEVKESAFLGQIVCLAGCLFVERRNRSNLKGEIGELTEGLNSGINVTIFPEATSTNGEGVLRFKRPLFESSIVSNRPTLPVTINYVSISGKKVDTSNRDIVCWYGDMDFFPHFLLLLEQSEVVAEITISEPILPRTSISQELAQKSYEQVLVWFRPLNTLPQESL
jgi:lyso-ornithine lipid O-acyltransferase